jgi:hypothetical protein
MLAADHGRGRNLAVELLSAPAGWAAPVLVG